MKIKVKDKNAQSVVPGILFISLFGISSIGIIIGSSEKFKGKYTLNNISNVINDLGIVSLLAAIFFCVSLFLLLYLIKPPKKCTATVLNIDKSDNENIVELLVKDNSKVVMCDVLVKDSTNLVLNKKYNAFVKEFNWKVLYLNDYNEEIEAQLKIKIIKYKILLSTIAFIVIFRIIMFGG